MDQREFAAVPPAADAPVLPGARPVEAANEDSPAGAHLHRLISRRPNRAVLYGALAITVFYLGVAAAYVWGLYGTRPLAAIPPADLWTIGATIGVPVFLLWLTTYLIWQSQQLRLMSEALARTAMRLTEPEDIATEQVATVAQAVRREIDDMKAGVDDALEQATALNALLSRQLESLEAGTGRAEYRARAIEEVLNRNRAGLEDIARALGAESDAITRSVRAQVDSVRGISQKAERELNDAADKLTAQTESLARVTEAATASADSTANMLDRQSSRLEVVAETALAKANELSGRYERQRGAVMEAVNRLEEGRTELDRAFLAQRAQIEEMAQALAARTAEVDRTVGEFAARVDKTATDLAGKIEGALHAADDRTKVLGKTFAAQISMVINAAEDAAAKVSTAAQQTTGTVAQATDTLRKSTKSLGDQTAALAEDVEKHAAALRMDLDNRNKDIRSMLQSTANEIEQTSERLGATMFRIGGAAKDAGRSLHVATDDLERRMEELPEEAAAGARALREVIEEQVSALAAIAEIVVRHARTLDKTAPAPSAPSPTGPLPVVEARLATQMGPPVMRGAKPTSSVSAPPAIPLKGGKSAGRRWGISELLAAAGGKETAAPPAEGAGGKDEAESEFHRTSLHVIETLQSLAIDLDRALEQSPPVELWHRYQSGERNVFARRLYNLNGRELYDQIAAKYRTESEFREIVDRFIQLFERLLTAASERDRDDILAETYLTSDTGKVYMILAQASGHLS